MPRSSGTIFLHIKDKNILNKFLLTSINNVLLPPEIKPKLSILANVRSSFNNDISKRTKTTILHFCVWLVTSLKSLCSNFQNFPELLPYFFRASNWWQNWQLYLWLSLWASVATSIMHKNVCSLYFF